MFKGGQNRLDITIVEGESRTIPVIACAKFAQLLVDRISVFLAPCPDLFDQRLAPHIISSLALFGGELLLHFHLRRNTSVIRAGKAQRFVALHALTADDGIVDGMLNGVAHVQLTGHVWRRDRHTIRRPPRISVGLEVSRILPALVPFGFAIAWFVGAG